MPRVTPTVVSVLGGVGASWLRKNDIDNGRVTLSRQWGTYAEGGAALLGIVSDMAHLNLNREITDTLYIAGATLFSERIGRSAFSGSFGTGSPMASRGARSYAAPMNARSGAGFATKEYSPTVF